jgi:hypothetical protein
MTPHEVNPSDHPVVPGSGDAPAGGDVPAGGDAPGAPDPTGHAGVDAVLTSLADLEDRPVGEHVAVFESAHARLRDALAQAADDPSY